MTAKEWGEAFGIGRMPHRVDEVIADLAAAEERAEKVQREWDKWVEINAEWIGERAILLAERDRLREEVEDYKAFYETAPEGEPYPGMEANEEVRAIRARIEGRQQHGKAT